MRNVKVHAQYSFMRQGVEVWLYGLFGCNPAIRKVAAPLEFIEPPMGQISEPTFILGDEEAQQFMDSLWSAGLRPTEGKGSAGALAATQEHLKDMRAIAFAALDYQVPK